MLIELSYQGEGSALPPCLHCDILFVARLLRYLVYALVPILVDLLLRDLLEWHQDPQKGQPHRFVAAGVPALQIRYEVQ